MPRNAIASLVVAVAATTLVVLICALSPRTGYQILWFSVFTQARGYVKVLFIFASILSIISIVARFLRINNSSLIIIKKASLALYILSGASQATFLIAVNWIYQPYFGLSGYNFLFLSSAAYSLSGVAIWSLLHVVVKR